MSSTARSRTGRHAAITRLIEQGDIASQEQLRAALAAAGIATTQATLSRDLVDLGATKVRTANGRSVYRLPDTDAPTPEVPVDSQLARRAADLLATADTVLNQVILRTPPGAAQLLAAALDRHVLPGVLGCVAGDDTVLIVCRGQAEAEETHSLLLRLAGRSA
ncbi:arginine repressor [Buchananella hordeovulneris]|uniref:arginine repressor n=1 Tax=Buchananella hordeovulneris TaxID=52770 RepID=UPI000F5E864E|nr:ArgR family transcriptional regulator [Buchananella hordeovulneris]MDO5081042.1 ArgR family transcriptional regulator [Buchananella hordeovulneris]RRD41836.1 ArgR family transcriptional regulator [Buchananella hordeovulneris]